MCGEVSYTLLGTFLLLGSIEVLQRDGDIRGKAAQQFHEFRREIIEFGGSAQECIDRLATAEQRQRGTGSRTGLNRQIVVFGKAWIAQIVVDDARQAGTGRRYRQGSATP